MKSSRQDILASLKKPKKEVAKEYSVKTMGVFGSVARDEQTGQSDIDLLVEFSKPVGFCHLYAAGKFPFRSTRETGGSGDTGLLKTGNPSGCALRGHLCLNGR